MSTCYCGKTTRPPFCDGSHWLSDEEYKSRSEKLQFLKKDYKMKWLDQVVNSIPEHSQHIAQMLKDNMEKDLLTYDQKNGIAYVAALSSGNGELAFEIEMDTLTNNPLRETLKGIVTEMSVRNVMQDYMDMHKPSNYDTKQLIFNVEWFQNPNIQNYFKYSSDPINNIYCYSISICQRSKSNSEYFLLRLKDLLYPSDKLDNILMISSCVSNINKITV